MSIELDNSFTVPVPPDDAWKVLLDVARIAPCMPGATVDSVEGDVVTGGIKVKVGPVQLTYRGTATFTDRDESTRTIFVNASGKEARGAGTASATVKASLTAAEGAATLVEMHTTMNVTGRPAQFGRGVMVEVGGKLVDKFAANLAVLLAADTAAEPVEEAALPVAEADPETAPVPEASLNLVRLVGPAILKRVVPVAAVAAAVALLGRRIRRGLRHGKA